MANQSPGLLFTALAYDNIELLNTREKLSPERKSEEIKRTYPIWEPILWAK